MTVLVTIAVYRIPPDLLERAVRSVLAQTYTDLQLLVIGDGEPVTLDVTDDRLEVHNLPVNRGPYFCQAVALAASRHEWYGTIGADDWIEPDHIEALLAANATAVVPTYVWNDGKHVTAWLGETGIVSTERLRSVGGYNPAERFGQDTLTMRLLQEHGGIVRTPVRATYHRERREGSLTTSPETGMRSLARRALILRNRKVLYACRRKPLDWIRDYRASLIPESIRDAVYDAADQVAGW